MIFTKANFIFQFVRSSLLSYTPQGSAFKLICHYFPFHWPEPCPPQIFHCQALQWVWWGSVARRWSKHGKDGCTALLMSKTLCVFVHCLTSSHPCGWACVGHEEHNNHATATRTFWGFWLSVNSMPGEDLRFYSVVKDELMLLLI